ncbi:TonB-dependent siderophore receptor [Pseudochelatococcus sp. B33]
MGFAQMEERGMTGSRRGSIARNKVTAKQRLAIALLGSTILGCSVLVSPPAVRAQTRQTNADQAVRFSIAAQSLSSAVDAFSRATGWQIGYSSRIARSTTTRAVYGTMSPREALQTMLAGTNVRIRFTGPTSAALVDASEVSDAGGAVDADGSLVLDTITVEGQVGSANTDGTGSYTSSMVTVAGKLPVNVREVPNSVSVVTRQRMDDQNMTTLQDALKQTTGVVALPYSGNLSGHYSSRSFGLGTQYEGMSATTGIRGMPQFDLAMYDRIEVLRGPAALFNGVGEIGGVVNLVRRRPLDIFKIGGGIDVGSWNNYHGYVDVTGPLVPSGAIRGRAILAGTDQHYFYNTAFSQRFMGYGIVEADLGPNTTLTLSGAHQESRSIPLYGWGTYPDGRFLNISRSVFPGASWGISQYPSTEGYADIKHRFDNGWVLRGSFLHRDTEVTGNQAYVYSALDPIKNTASLATQTMDQRYDVNIADVHLGGPIDFLGRTHQFVFGANYSYGLNHVGSSPFTVLPDWYIYGPSPADPGLVVTNGTDTRTVQYGVYGQSRIKVLDPLTLVLGGRLSNYEAETRQYLPVKKPWSTTSKVSSRFSPYAGIVYDLTRDISVYASYSDIFLPQSLLASDGSALSPEQGRQLEAGVKGQFFDGKLNASFAVFNIKDTNRALADAANPGYYTASGEVTTNGLEAEISGELTPGWNIYAGYSYARSEYSRDPVLQGQRYDPRQPEQLFKLWTSYNFQNPMLSGWSIGGGARLASDMRSDSAPIIKQGGYAVFDAQIGYQFSENVKATLTVNNIFDNRYYERVGWTNWFNQFGTPRSVTFSLRSTF